MDYVLALAGLAAVHDGRDLGSEDFLGPIELGAAQRFDALEV